MLSGLVSTVDRQFLGVCKSTLPRYRGKKSTRPRSWEEKEEENMNTWGQEPQGPIRALRAADDAGWASSISTETSLRW